MSREAHKIFSFGEILFDDYGKYKVLGGAPFNYIFHLNKFGYTGNLISKVGNDEEGKEILNRLKQRSIPTNYIQVDNTYKTGLVSVKLDEDGVPSYIINENMAYDFIHEENLDNVKCSLFYFGTLAQRTIQSRDTLYNYLNEFKRGFFDVNLRQKFYNQEIITRSLNNASIVKINNEELNIITKLIYNINSSDIHQNAKKILNDFRLDILSITMGSDGALLVNDSDSHFHVEKANNIIDTVGAGDAYSAVLSIGYLEKWDLEKINVIASKFAAGICSIKGAIPEEDNFYNKYIEII
jgi:fructokinase